MNITYTRQGNYLFPDLTIAESKVSFGKYGILRKQFLKEHRKGHYTSLLLSGKLDEYLYEIDQVANERLDQTVAQMKSAEGVTEELKADNPLVWIQKVTNIVNRAEEIILAELIYV